MTTLRFPNHKELALWGAALFVGVFGAYSWLSAKWEDKVQEYEAAYHQEHLLARDALTKLKLLGNLLDLKDAEIRRLKESVPPTPPPVPLVVVPETATQAAAELKLAGVRVRALEAAVALALPETAVVLRWHHEAARVPGLEARGAALEGVIRAQDERIAQSDEAIKAATEAAEHERRAGEAALAAVMAAKKQAEAERSKGKLKLYGGVAVGLGAGWLIFK